MTYASITLVGLATDGYRSALLKLQQVSERLPAERCKLKAYP